MKEVFSSGGGTQSTAISALIIQGKLPKPDVIVIADTGYEKSTTWEYLDSVVRPALAKIGLEVHRIGPEWATQPKHGNRFLSHNKKTVLIPGFTNQVEGEIGKLPGFCSNTWKVEVVNRYLRKALGIPTREQKRWIGFSLDESRRASKMMLGADYKAGLVRFPLIHDYPIRRSDAINEVLTMGWPLPPRSACYLCPNQNDEEWLDNTAEENSLAAHYEREIQKIDPHMWLHSSCKPINTVSFDKNSEDGADRACSSGACFL